MRGLLFLVLFILFLLIKLALQGGKKILEIGAEAYDAVNNTEYSEIFKKSQQRGDELAYEKAIIGLHSLIAFEKGDAALNILENELIAKAKELVLQHMCLRWTVTEEWKKFSDPMEYIFKNEKMVQRFEKELIDVIKMIKRRRLSFAKKGCLFETIRSELELYAKIVDYFDEGLGNVKTKTFADLVRYAVSHGMERCQKRLLHTIGQRFGFSASYIDDFLENATKLST